MLATALSYLFPGINFLTECVLVDDGSGVRIAEWRRAEPQPTDAEIAAAAPAAQAAADAAEAQRLADKAARQELRDNFQQWKDKLQAVRDEIDWTNAKRDAALKDLAQVQVKMLGVLKTLALD